MTKLVTRSITENQNKLPGDRKVQNFERSELLQNASVKFGHIPHQGILSHRYASIEENVFHSHIQRRPMGLLNRGDFIRSTSHNCHANVRNLNFGIQTSDTCSAKCTESKASKRYIPLPDGWGQLCIPKMFFSYKNFWRTFSECSKPDTLCVQVQRMAHRLTRLERL